MKFENPTQFYLRKELDKIKIQYSNLMEISQGGPEIGNLTVNNNLIFDYRFGGPCILYDKFIFAPIIVRRFFGVKFKLAKIDSKNLKITMIGKCMNLIYLDRIEDDKIYYFKDYQKTLEAYYEIGNGTD